MKPSSIARATRFLSIYIGALFLAYCLIFLCVCPSARLGCAVALEIALFSVSLALINKRFSLLPTRVTSFLDYLQNLPPLHHPLLFIRSLRLAAITLVALFVSLDFTAFCSAAFCNTPLTATLYALPPGSQLLGLHPAATLESLAGAFVERRDFAKAEQLYNLILSVRRTLTGPRSDLVAALYADFGDLNVRKHSLPDAERFYRKATEIAPESGRSLTGLATTLREEGFYDESEKYYKRALACRARMFGTSSRLFNDTLRAYEKLKQRRRTAGS